MDNPFDTEINTAAHQGLDNTTMTVADITGGAVATVVDIGASLWNSLPGTPEVATTDLLSRISGDALRVYNEHPDTVQAASFIGGMFVPMGLAAKGMGLMRSGIKGVNWFTNAGREADLAKVASMFERAADGTAEYRALTRSIYAKTAVNQAIDAVVMEAALVGLYNAHPFMEDYQKDLAKNFTTSALIGGALGSGIGVVADRFVLKNLTGGIAEAAAQTVRDSQRTITADMTSTIKLQSYDVNIKNLEEIIQQRKALGKSTTDDLVYHIAETEQLALKAEQATLFEDIISPEIKALPKEQKDEFMRLLVDKTEMFGVEKISLLTEKEVTAKGLVKAPKFSLDSQPSLVSTNSKGGPTIPKAKEAVYFPDLGLYGTKADAIHYAGAVTFGKTKEQLLKDYKIKGNVPNYDTSLELLSKGAADVQAEYIATWEKVMQMKPHEVAKLHIAESDGPWINALLYRLSVDTEFASKFSGLKMSDNSPVIKQILKEHTETLVASGKMAPGSTGPGSSYAAAMEQINATIDNYVPGGTFKSANKASYYLIRDWIGGNKQELNRLAIEHHSATVGGFAKTGVKHEDARKFEAIYNSDESKALRAKFMELADSEGNVFLYRGWKTNDIKGASPLDSYTTHYQKAQQFIGRNRERGVKLYKVPVEDIVAGFKDVGEGAYNAEIIVRASARPVVAELSGSGKAFMQKEAEEGLSAVTTTKTTVTQTVQNIQDGTKTIDKAGLESLFIAQKQEAIDTLLNSGMPLESIAIKTNTDSGVVKAYAMLRQNGTGLEALVPPNTNPLVALNKIKTYDQIDEVLSPKNQPIVLKGNLRKNPLYTQNHAALNNRDMRTISKEFTAQTMLASKSSAVQEMVDLFYGPEGFGHALDVIGSKIGKINNELFGSGFLSSFDFASRNLQEVGPAVSAIGKAVQRTSNNLIKKVVDPISDAMTSVQKDINALTEFNVFYNVNAGLKGWRNLDKDFYLVQKVEKIDEAGKPVTVLERVKHPETGQEYQLKTESVRKLVDAINDQGNELRELTNTIRRVTGAADVNDIGLWIPSFNPVDKFIAYVHNSVDDTTKLLWAKSEKEFDTLVKAYKDDLVRRGQDKYVKVVTRAEQADWNILNGRLDPINMERADVSMQKGGSSAAAVIKPDVTLLGEIAKGYEHYITSQVRNLADLNMSEITEGLQRISAYNNRNSKNQPLTEVTKAISKAINKGDSAAIVRNTLLGNSNLGEYAGWQSLNKGFEVTLGIAANSMARVWDATVKPLTKTIFGNKKELDAKKIDWKAYVDGLEKEGIIHPFKDWDAAAAEKMGVFNIENAPDASKRVIYASNALAATLALRFAELAQPLVNIMSMPVLTGLAISQKMPETFMSVQKATAKVWPTQVMFEGVRAMNSPLFKDLNKKWEKAGYFSPMVSEASDVLRATRKFEKGAMAAIENALDSKMVEVMSKPADLAESFTRKAAMNTGAVLAKRLYPELDDVGITIFARDFMDKAIGNFHASQRPVFYQGTLGVAMGLFQTYMLTLGQSVYRHLELKNYKELGKAALTQQTLFGAGSLPGFDQISQYIGEHFSDENIDLTTGTYRALPDRLADFIIYGMPSNLGPSFNTRGDITLRAPTTPLALDKTVAFQFATQTMTMMQEIQNSLGADSPDMARSLAQALSLQSMSRPLARGSELLTGYSITKQGNTVQTPEEVWSFQGVAARVMATRPIAEQKLRDADHLNHFYGAADREERQQLMEDIRTKIRNGTLSEESIAKASEKYFRHGGSPAGWRSALNEAIGRTEASGKEAFIQKLKPDNPLTFMINNLD